MSKAKANKLLELLGAMAEVHGTKEPPFSNYQELIDKIDSTKVGDVPWQQFEIQHPQNDLTEDSPTWMRATYDVYYRDPLEVLKNLLKNHEFHGKFDYIPHIDFDASGSRSWKDFMTGNWAWKQAVRSHDLYNFMFYLT